MSLRVSLEQRVPVHGFCSVCPCFQLSACPWFLFSLEQPSACPRFLVRSRVPAHGFCPRFLGECLSTVSARVSLEQPSACPRFLESWAMSLRVSLEQRVPVHGFSWRVPVHGFLACFFLSTVSAVRAAECLSTVSFLSTVSWRVPVHGFCFVRAAECLSTVSFLSTVSWRVPVHGFWFCPRFRARFLFDPLLSNG
jgi:hypothetical protein